MVGSVPLVKPPSATLPRSVTLVMEGAPGSVASTLTVNGKEAGPVLPAGSVAFTVSVWLPSESAVVNV